MAVSEGENRDADSADENRRDLPDAKPLAQNHGTEQHVDQRRHKIAQTSFEDATDIDCPNEEEPVHANHHSTCETKQRAAARVKVCDHFGPPPLPAEQRAEEDNGPDKPVRENFQRRNFAE